MLINDLEQNATAIRQIRDMPEDTFSQLNFSYTPGTWSRWRMSKHDKTLARMQAKPVPANITWDEMAAALKHLGYQLLKNSGSRRKFYHKERDALISCHQPHPEPTVDKGCIADVVEHLKAKGFIKDRK